MECLPMFVTLLFCFFLLPNFHFRLPFNQWSVGMERYVEVWHFPWAWEKRKYVTRDINNHIETVLYWEGHTHTRTHWWNCSPAAVPVPCSFSAPVLPEAVCRYQSSQSSPLSFHTASRQQWIPLAGSETCKKTLVDSLLCFTAWASISFHERTNSELVNGASLEWPSGIV